MAASSETQSGTKTGTRSGASARLPGFGPTRWPEPPTLPEPPRRTEPLHIPTVLAPAEPPCPDPAGHYACETVADLEASTWEAVLRDRYAAGYRLVQLVRDEGGPALLLFEHTAH